MDTQTVPYQPRVLLRVAPAVFWCFKNNFLSFILSLNLLKSHSILCDCAPALSYISKVRSDKWEKHLTTLSGKLKTCMHLHLKNNAMFWNIKILLECLRLL